MQIKLNIDIKEYIKNLKNSYPNITSTWLIGSRANGTAKPNSDWDFIVFANNETLENIRNNHEFHKENIDLLIVYNESGDFAKPWGKKKTGNLKNWAWKNINENETSYESAKFIKNEKRSQKFNAEMGDIETETFKAFKINV